MTCESEDNLGLRAEAFFWLQLILGLTWALRICDDPGGMESDKHPLLMSSVNSVSQRISWRDRPICAVLALFDELERSVNWGSSGVFWGVRGRSNLWPAKMMLKFSKHLMLQAGGDRSLILDAGRGFSTQHWKPVRAAGYQNHHDHAQPKLFCKKTHLLQQLSVALLADMLSACFKCHYYF